MTEYGKCRFCNENLTQIFVDLGKTPLSNSFLKKSELTTENSFPLRAYVCTKCLLVQLEEFEKPENIFKDYAYFSSYSTTWINHIKNYVDFMINEYDLDKNNCIVELASNDGYLLQFFQEKDFKVLGIEPAENVAKVARKKGITTLSKFFGTNFANELKSKNIQADLIIGNNVLAHVPDLNDFVKGMKILLKPSGIITMEFPHLLKLLQENQFDTIYHEHFSYFSFLVVNKIFEHHKLRIFDVSELSTHGGSLRIFVCHAESNKYNITKNVETLLRKEIKNGLNKLESYENFSKQTTEIKNNLLKLLQKIKNESKSICCYGAPAKGNTLLNFCKIPDGIIDYTVDINSYKQGLYLPGTHIPIYNIDKIKETKPDYVLILPWNIKEEITEQLSYIRKWNAKFITTIPSLDVF